MSLYEQLLPKDQTPSGFRILKIMIATLWVVFIASIALVAFYYTDQTKTCILRNIYESCETGCCVPGSYCAILGVNFTQCVYKCRTLLFCK